MSHQAKKKMSKLKRFEEMEEESLNRQSVQDQRESFFILDNKKAGFQYPFLC